MLTDVWLLPCWVETPVGHSRMRPLGMLVMLSPPVATSHHPPGFSMGGTAEIRAAPYTSCPTSQPAGKGMGVPFPATSL